MNHLLSIIVFLFSASAQAAVYKWVDEAGTVHYGDKPEVGSQLIEVRQYKTRNIPPEADENQLSRAEKRQRISDMLEEDRLEKNKQRNKKRLERKRKRQECNRLRDRQRHVERASGLYNLDKDGNRVFMSSEQRQKSEQKLRKRIQKVCG